MLSGEEWKYADEGAVLTALDARRYCANRTRLLVVIEGCEQIQETRIYEVSPDASFVKLGCSNGWMAGTIWLRADKVHVCCVLREQSLTL